VEGKGSLGREADHVRGGGERERGVVDVGEKGKRNGPEKKKKKKGRCVGSASDKAGQNRTRKGEGGGEAGSLSCQSGRKEGGKEGEGVIWYCSANRGREKEGLLRKATTFGKKGITAWGGKERKVPDEVKVEEEASFSARTRKKKEIGSSLCLKTEGGKKEREGSSPGSQEKKKKRTEACSFGPGHRRGEVCEKGKNELLPFYVRGFGEKGGG